jgi:O-antigen ligase
MSTANIDVKILSKYLSIVILISTIVILFKHININLFIKLTIITSTLLVFLNILNVIRPSGAGELSYLILSLQVTIGVSALLGRSFFSTNYKVFYCVLLLINLFGVLSQAGRSSVLACLLLIIMTFILFSIVHFKNNRILIGALWVFIVSISIYVFNYLLEYVFNDYFIYKMESLLSGGGDTRFSTYFEAVNIIKDAPLGLGVNGYLNQLGFYPHNIFLEIGLNIGILGVLFFLGIFLSFVFLYLKKIYNGKVVIADDLSLFLMALSLFISWNTSNSLSSSYPLFLCLLLSTLSSVKRKNEVI